MGEGAEAAPGFPPQNQNTEITLLGVGLKTAKKIDIRMYSNRMLKYANRAVEQLKNVFLKRV